MRATCTDGTSYYSSVNRCSFTDPVGPPSSLVPLSDRSTISTSSSTPSSASAATSRPIWWSAWLKNPENTSIWRAKRRCSSADNEYQASAQLGQSASIVPAGTTPSSS